MNVANLPDDGCGHIYLRIGLQESTLRIPERARRGEGDRLCLAVLDTDISPTAAAILGRQLSEHRISSSSSTTSPVPIQISANQLDFVGIVHNHPYVDLSLKIYQQTFTNPIPRTITTAILVARSHIATASTLDGHNKAQCRIISCSGYGFIICNETELDRYSQETATHNLLIRFTSTEDGSRLMGDGTLLPVLGIQAWSYRLIVADHAVCSTELAFLGSEVLGDRFYRLTGDGKHVQIFDAQSLKNWTARERVCEEMAIEAGLYRLRIFAAGEHGEDWLPSYVLDLTKDGHPMSDPLINEDPGSLFSHLIVGF